MADASLIQIKEYFGMTPSEIMKDWKALNKEEQAYFKQAVGEEINK